MAFETGYVIWGKNIIKESLINREKIILPPLHIKLGLMKQFVKALNKDDSCFHNLNRSFPKQTGEKIKAGILDGHKMTANKGPMFYQ